MVKNIKTVGMDERVNTHRYNRMKAELLQKYPGQYVALYRGRVIAIDPDRGRLIETVKEKIGNVRAYIRQIQTEEPLIKLPVSRRVVPITHKDN